MNVGHREPDTRTWSSRGLWTLCLVNQVDKNHTRWEEGATVCTHPTCAAVPLMDSFLMLSIQEAQHLSDLRLCLLSAPQCLWTRQHRITSLLLLFVLPHHTFHTLLRSVWTVERRHFKASTVFICTWSHSHKHATVLLSFHGKISTTIYCPPPAPSSHCRWNCACNLFLTQRIYYVIINGVLLFYLFTIIVK